MANDPFKIDWSQIDDPQLGSEATPLTTDLISFWRDNTTGHLYSSIEDILDLVPDAVAALAGGLDARDDLTALVDGERTSWQLSVTPSSQDNLLVVIGNAVLTTGYSLSGDIITLDSAPISGTPLVVYALSDPSPASAGGSAEGDVQYRSSTGSLDAENAFSYDANSNTLTVDNITLSGTIDGVDPSDLDTTVTNIVGGSFTLDSRYYTESETDALILSAAGSISVDDEGSEVEATATRLNFVGAVSATSAGGGEVTVTITPGSAPVDSVFGRIGVVVAASGDYNADQITETATRIFYTTAEETKLSNIAENAVAEGAAGDAYATSHEADGTAHAASAIVNTPAGGVAATTVQAAIDELDTEKAPLASPTFTGTVTVPGDSFAYSKIQNTSGASVVLGRGDSGAGDLQELTFGSNIGVDGTVINVSTGTATLGDGDYTGVTVSGTGTVITVNADTITNAKAANMAADRIKGRITAGTGDPEDLTPTQVRTIINVEDGADATDATNVTAAGALMDSELTSLSGVKTLTVPDSTTISAFGATLIDDADQAAAQTTLGVDPAGTDNGEVTVVADKTALEASTVQSGLVYMQGYSSDGDGGEGFFEPRESGATADDGVISTHGSGVNWRFHRVYDGDAVSVLWFGAAGDGSTDDSTIINAVIAAYTEVHFPYTANGYGIGASIDPVNDFTILRGTGGERNVKLVGLPALTGSILEPSNPNIDYVNISGFDFTGECTDAIKMDSCTFWTIRDCRFAFFDNSGTSYLSGWCINVIDSWSNHFENLYAFIEDSITTQALGILKFDGECNSNNITSFYSSATCDHGVLITDDVGTGTPKGNQFSALQLQGMETGLDLQQCIATVVSGGYVEAVTNPMIFGSTGSSLHRCASPAISGVSFANYSTTRYGNNATAAINAIDLRGGTVTSCSFLDHDNYNSLRIDDCHGLVVSGCSKTNFANADNRGNIDASSADADSNFIWFGDGADGNATLYGLGTTIIREWFATAAPGSGTHVAGDRVRILVPTAGGHLVETCTTGGTPGTWKNAGQVSS